jgi:outer membrane cobalamin receptor
MKNHPGLKLLLCLLFACVMYTDLHAQHDSTGPVKHKDSVDYYDLSLDQLLKIKGHDLPTELESLINSLISVASKKPLSTRESPSIVTLVTEQEIRNSGARDLTDVLRLVPGFDFGVDVEGVVGIATRGNWAHEGKVLLLIDGQEMNEILYASTQFGNHYPIEQIKKIEIIRGPGSAIYGGFAEYGVINIITRSGADLNGISACASYGRTKDALARENLNLAIGKKIKDLEFSIAGLIGMGNRSDRLYTDFFGRSVSLAGTSDLNPANLNIGLSYKGLSFRGIMDGYSMKVGDGYDHALANPYLQSFNSTHLELKYIWKHGERFSLTPKFNYKRELPWYTPTADTMPPVLIPAYMKRAERYTGNLTCSYNFSRHMNVVAGAEVYKDVATELDAGYFPNGTKKIDYLNYAGFLQGLIKHRIVNIIFGARYDRHSLYGDALVPRVGLTKKISRFNFKLLYSRSFRSPAIENINNSTTAGVRPELTDVIELEAGYELTRKSFLTINLYDITTYNPIVYYVVGQNTDAYINFGRSGTRGVEAEYKTRHTWGYLTLNYAFYTTQGKSEVPNYQVPGLDNHNLLLAFPAHKLNLVASLKVSDLFSLNPSLLFRSESYGYTPNPDSLLTGRPQVSRFKPQLFVNLFLNCNRFFIRGLNVGLGVYDLFNQQTYFIEPYNGPHAPLPGPSRELVIRLRYDLSIPKKE